MDEFLSQVLKINPAQLSKYQDYFATLDLDFTPYSIGRHVIFKDSDKEIVLRVWDGSPSNYHSHPAGGCMFKVLQGCLKEERNSQIYHHTLNQTVFTTEAHKVFPSQECVTLHYYSNIAIN